MRQVHDAGNRRGSPWRSGARLAAVLAALLAGAPPAAAEERSKQQLQGLDEQVQEIKSDVLAISAELAQLEERLLFPSNTQVAVFVALPETPAFELDSVQIHIDGEPAARHIYSFKELEALRKGGVQRLYTGNVATGEHQIEVALIGKLPGGGEVRESGRFSFRKEVEPKLVGLTLAQGAGDEAIRLGSW